MRIYNAVCSSKARLDGKITVITGANTGIGKETARDFYSRGARVILACRNVEKAKAAVEDIKHNPFSSKRKQAEGKLGDLAVYPLDLCSFKSIRECARMLLKQEPAIHILVNNAGIMFAPYQLTDDGFEIQLQSNYLGHFLLTLLLLPKMQSSAPGCRIVNVSSLAHIFGRIHFNDINLEKSWWYLRSYIAYYQSKLANILFTKKLAQLMKETNSGINVYSLHPGVVRTELSRNYDNIFPGGKLFFRYVMRPFIKNSEQGAQTTIYCAVDEKAANETGLYYTECCVTRPSEAARNDQIAEDLWNYTCWLLRLEPNKDFSKFLKTVSRQLNK